MKTEAAVLLISTAELPQEEIIKILTQHNCSKEAYDAAFKTGKFSNQEILDYAKGINTVEFWIIALNNLPTKCKTKNLYLSVLRGVYHDDDSNLYPILDKGVELENMSGKTAIQIGIELSNLIDDDGFFIWKRILERCNKITKKQLLNLSQIIKIGDVLHNILHHLIAKKATKNELITLIHNQWVGKEMIIPVLKSGKFDKKEMFELLSKETYKGYGYEKTMAELFAIYKLDATEALKIVREINDSKIWELFQKTYPDYYPLLSEEELIYLLYHGDPQEKYKIIRVLSSETLKEILMDEACDSYTASYIINSGKIDKETALKTAERIKTYPIWRGLIRSGLLSDFEILDVATNIEPNDNNYVWEAVCETIDLSIFSFEKIIEMGRNANTESVWPYIVKTLKKRNEIKK